MKLDAITEYEVLEVKKPHIFHVSLGVTAGEASLERERPPLGVLFLLDNSSSMRGAALEAVKASVSSVCELLDERDRVGIISFEAMAHRQVPLRLLSEEHRASIERKLQSITNGLGTNISDALVLARGVFAAKKREGERAVVLLLSDGAPSRGERDLVALVEDARVFGKLGALSTLGFKRSHWSQLLQPMADAARGTYHYILDPAASTLEYTRALGAQQRLALTDLSLALTPAPGVSVENVHGALDVRTHTNGTLTLTLPDLTSGASARVLLQVKLDAGAEVGERPLFHGHATGEDLAQGGRCEEELGCVVALGHETGARPVPALVDMLLFGARQLRRQLARDYDVMEPQDTYRALGELRSMATALMARGVEDAWRRKHLDRLISSLEDERALLEHRAMRAYQDRLRYSHEERRETLTTCITKDSHPDIYGRSTPKARGVLVFTGGPREGEERSFTTSMVLGASASCEFVLGGEGVANRHAELCVEDEHILIRDLGSLDGIELDGVKTSGANAIEDAVVKIGAHVFRITHERA